MIASFTSEALEGASKLLALESQLDQVSKEKQSLESRVKNHLSELEKAGLEVNSSRVVRDNAIKIFSLQEQLQNLEHDYNKKLAEESLRSLDNNLLVEELQRAEKERIDEQDRDKAL